MKLTDIDIENITEDIIKNVLFNTPKNEYMQADCVILFGCHLKPLLDERINLAIDILKNKKIGKILLTGGVGVNGNFNESDYMKQKLLEHGIKEDAILIEDKSTTTEENIINSLQILKNNNLLENRKLILVSNQAHLRRIGMELKKQLKGTDTEIIYEYPKESMISFNNVIRDSSLRQLAVNEVKKIIRFIDMNIIDDEDI
ncbi:MAG: YdcF family protein [Clostridia bacterium]|nr:YdcF family protein [Clostridia bacterium]